MHGHHIKACSSPASTSMHLLPSDASMVIIIKAAITILSGSLMSISCVLDTVVESDKNSLSLSAFYRINFLFQTKTFFVTWAFG